MKKFLFLFLFPITIAFSQISISTGNSVIENFNSLGISAAATLPSNWKVDKLTTVRTVGKYISAVNNTNYVGGSYLSATAGNGVYNFGLGDASTASDRALGGLSSGSNSQSINIYSYFQNAGSTTITQVDISYDVMRFRNGLNAAGFSIQLYYSTDGITWNSAGSNFLASFSTNADNNGAAIVPIEKKQILNQTLTGLYIPQNGVLYLAWNYSVSSGTTTSNAQALGLDNFVINNIGGATTVPAAPLAIAASNITATGFTANWNSTSGAASYLLDVSNSSDFSKILSGYNNKDAGNSTSVIVSFLSPGTTYYYRIKAANAFGISTGSNIVSVTTSILTTSVQFQGISDAVSKATHNYNLVLTIANPDPIRATTCTVTFVPDSSTASAAYLNNFSTQSVTFPAASSDEQKIVFTIVDNGIAEPAKKAFLQIQNVSGGASASPGAISKFKLSITSGIDNNYYSIIQQGLTGSALKNALHDLIKNNIKYPYTDNSSSTSIDVWKMCKAADEDPKNPNNIIGIYSGLSIAKEPQDYWNREHVWSKSHGNFGTDIGPGTDGHHLRPENPTINSLKGNLDFDNGGNPVPNANGSKYDTDSWEPRDEVKGDVARMIFYMSTRYSGDNGEPNLQVVENIPSSKNNEPLYGRLSSLLQWNRQDPPDAFEMNRNNVIYFYQHNRNPFIDHPEWINFIWGNISDVAENYGDYSMSNYFLYQNYPNPFNPSTIIKYSLPKASNVQLTIIDIIGREIKTFSFDAQLPGYQTVQWNGTDNEGGQVSSGVYIYTLKAISISDGKEFRKSAKLLLIK